MFDRFDWQLRWQLCFEQGWLQGTASAAACAAAPAALLYDRLVCGLCMSVASCKSRMTLHGGERA